MTVECPHLTGTASCSICEELYAVRSELARQRSQEALARLRSTQHSTAQAEPSLFDTEASQ